MRIIVIVIVLSSYDVIRFYIMPYWSRGQLGIREGDYTGTQKYFMNASRSMAFNILLANTIVSRL